MRMRVKYNEARAGFTLLEILVSMMIFSVLMAAIGGVLAAALHLRNATNDALESTFPLRTPSSPSRMTSPTSCRPPASFSPRCKPPPSPIPFLARSARIFIFHPVRLTA